MSKFTPSEYSGSDSSSLEETVELLAPGFFSAIFGGDARSSAAVLEAEIAALEKQIAEAGFVKDLILGATLEKQLAVKKAELEAAREKEAEAEVADAAILALYVGGALLTVVTIVAVGAKIKLTLAQADAVTADQL